MTEAAKRLGISRKQLSDIVNCHAGISPEMAIRLDKAFGGGAETWLRLQAAYDLARAMRERYPAALVYLLAGGFDVYDEVRATECGVDGKISVPFTARSLRSKVEEAIGLVGFGLPEITSPDLSELPDAVPSYDGPLVGPRHNVPVSEERLATFLPRDFRQPEPVSVDPEVVGPALERAILEVLPEVVEGVLRNALVSSPEFREIVAQAVEKAVKEELAKRG